MKKKLGFPEDPAIVFDFTEDATDPPSMEPEAGKKDKKKKKSKKKRARETNGEDPSMSNDGDFATDNATAEGRYLGAMGHIRIVILY